MWPRCYEAATRSNSAAEKGGKQPKDLAKVLLVTPSQFEATTAAILCILCVGVCLAAAVRWRLCCVGRCVSDTWRYTVWYFEGPDEETESLLKDPECNEADCSMRHPHKHHRDGSISVRRSRAERRRGAAAKVKKSPIRRRPSLSSTTFQRPCWVRLINLLKVWTWAPRRSRL
jgi:hypothetical protein